MESIITDKKRCEYCKKDIRGRSDKKFCNDYCRNIYNNQLHAVDNNFIRNINNALLKNRRILYGLMINERIIKINKEELLHLGFQFKYQTHYHKGKSGTPVFGCYDYYYVLSEEEKCVIIKNSSKH